jgi:signal transduction histidine kinase
MTPRRHAPDPGAVIGQRRRRTPISASRGAYAALRSTGFTEWLVSLPDGGLELISRTTSNLHHLSHGYHIHSGDLARLTAAYEAARADGEPFDLDCRICDGRGGSRYTHCWFGIRFITRGANGPRLIMLERPLFAASVQRGPAAHEADRHLAQDRAEDRERESELFAFVAHQLRSPITTIMGNGHLLHFREHDLSRSQRHQALDDLVESTHRLNTLLDDLLRFAKIADVSRSGEQPAPVAVPEVVSHVVHRHAKADPARPVRFSAPAALPAAWGTIGYVDQIVDNLLTNARKYSASGASVDVVLESDGDRVIVRVLDRGVGIDPGDAERIFMPFYRSARVRGLAEGSGIGLAVCKRMVEALGGSISAHPRPDGGTEFVVALRRAAANPAPGGIAPDQGRAIA